MIDTGRLRRIAIALLIVVFTLGVAVPAMSDVDSIAGNSVDVFLSVTPTAEYRDGTVAYTVTAFNASFVQGANDAWIDVTFTPPAADGTASGTPIVLATGELIEVGETITWNSTTNPDLEVALSHIDEGVSLAYGMVDYYALYDADPVYQATGSKNIPVTILPYAELGDFVWNDLNRDGIQDPGEPGIEGVTVNLWSADAECELIEQIDTTTTDEYGYYLFDELRAGKYYVQFILPDGDWVFTARFAGDDTTVDSNADPDTGISDCVTLAAGGSDLTIDAGMYELFEELEVSKTAETSYIRTHEWDIDKKVETEFGHVIGEEEYPKIWLYQDASGDETATWTVDVTYLGYEDSDFSVEGTVTIENTGELDAVITGVEDLLGGSVIDVDFGVTFPYTLAVGDTLEGTYSEDGYVEGMNEVTVTTEVDDYTAEAAIVWGDPAEELYKVVNVEDVSDIFGTVWLGMLDADDYAVGEGETFTYDKFFAWTDYAAPGPYVYDNTATIIETMQSASARLVVNWEFEELCWADETAWAYGGDFANPNWDYVNNRFWGWTNGPLSEGSYEWDIYAGAGQNDLSKGTVVGTLYVDYDDGCVTVTYELDEGYYLGETHLWVGDDVLPMVKRGRTSVYTNAPGQFPYGESFGFDSEDPSTWTTTTWTWSKCGFEGDIYVAAHSVVWMQVECPQLLE